MKIQFYNIRRNTMPVLTEDVLASSINRLLFRKLKGEFTRYSLSEKPVYDEHGILTSSRVSVEWEFIENGLIESRIIKIGLLDEHDEPLEPYISLKYLDNGVVESISIRNTEYRVLKRSVESAEIYYLSDNGSEIDFAKVVRRYTGYGIHEIASGSIKDATMIINVKNDNTTVDEFIDGDVVYSITPIFNEFNEKTANHVICSKGNNREYQYITYLDGKTRYIYPSDNYVDESYFMIEGDKFIFNRYDDRGIPYAAYCVSDDNEYDILFRDKNIYTLDYIYGFRPIVKLRCLETLKEYDFGKEYESIGWFASRFMNAQFNQAGQLVEFVNHDTRYLVDNIDASTTTNDVKYLVKVKSLDGDIYIDRAYLKNGNIIEIYRKPSVEKDYKDIMYKRFTIY